MADAVDFRGDRWVCDKEIHCIACGKQEVWSAVPRYRCRACGVWFILDDHSIVKPGTIGHDDWQAFRNATKELSEADKEVSRLKLRTSVSWQRGIWLTDLTEEMVREDLQRLLATTQQPYDRIVLLAQTYGSDALWAAMELLDEVPQ